MNLITAFGKLLLSGASNHIFPLFQNESFAPTLAFAIFIVFLIITGAFFLHLRRPWQELKACKQQLAGFNTWEDFAKGFGVFDSFVKGTKLLAHGWHEFTETIILPIEGENRAIWITLRPSVFLNITDAEKQLGLKRFKGWANIFVGLGLLLTFLGLVAALYFAASGIEKAALENAAGTQNSAKEIQKALIDLLKTASFKFWTSISGLGCSILITLIHNLAARSFTANLASICNRIEKLTQTVTPEFFANLQYRETQEQTTQLKEFNAQLAFNVGTALEKVMPSVMGAAMAPVVERLSDLTQNSGQAFEGALTKAMPPVMSEAMKPVADQISSMAANISAMNQSALQDLTKEFGNVLTDNAGKELGQLTVTLSQLQDTLTATSNQMNGSGAETARQLAEATADLRSVMGELVKGIDRISKGVESDLSRTQGALQDQLASVNASLATVAETIKSALTEVGRELTDTSRNAAGAFGDQIAHAVGRIETTAASNAASMAMLVESLRVAAKDATGSLATETAGASQALQEAVERMAASMDAASSQLRERSTETAGTLTTTLTKTIQQLQETTHQNADLIREAVMAITGAGKTASQDVDKAARNVGTELQKRGQEAAGELVSGANSVLIGLSTTVDGLRSRVDGLATALAATEAKIATYAVVLEKVNTSSRSTADVMASTAKSLTDATAPLTFAEQNLARSSQALGQSVDRFLSGVQSAQENFNRLSDKQREAFDEIKHIWLQYEERFNNVDASLGRTVEKIIDDLGSNAKSINDYVKNVDSHLASTVGQLAGNIEELALTAEEYRKAAEAFRDAAGKMR